MSNVRAKVFKLNKKNLSTGLFALAICSFFSALYFSFQAGCAGDVKTGVLGNPSLALQIENFAFSIRGRTTITSIFINNIDYLNFIITYTPLHFNIASWHKLYIHLAAIGASCLVDCAQHITPCFLRHSSDRIACFIFGDKTRGQQWVD